MRGILELVRVYLSATAPADSWTGFFLAEALAGDTGLHLDDAPRLGVIALTSLAAYWAGMISNDLFDLEKDRTRAPRRPLVKGEVSPRTARSALVALGLVAVAGAWYLDALPLLVALLAAILAYNGGGKRIPVVGNLLMGSCRGLNLALGAAASPAESITGALGHWQILAAMTAITLYVALVTAISVLEDHPYRRSTLRAALSALLTAPAGLLACGWTHPGSWANSIAFALHLAAGGNLPRVHTEGPHPAELVVRRGLGGLFFLDAGFLWCLGLAGPTVAIYLLLFLGRWLAAAWFRPRP